MFFKYSIIINVVSNAQSLKSGQGLSYLGRTQFFRHPRVPRREYAAIFRLGSECDINQRARCPDLPSCNAQEVFYLIKITILLRGCQK